MMSLIGQPKGLPEDLIVMGVARLGIEWKG